MKRFLVFFVSLLSTAVLLAGEFALSSPNGRLKVTIGDNGGQAAYSVSYDGVQVLLPSRLGFEADFGDFTKDLTIGEPKMKIVDSEVTLSYKKLKHSAFKSCAHRYSVPFRNAKGQMVMVVFHVANNDIAFRYEIARPGENPKCGVIRREVSSFRFPDGTTTFLTPQIGPMTGWERTKPS